MPLRVSSTSICRPSVGCGRRRTIPLSSSDRTVPVIHCGRTRSVAARSFVLSGNRRRRWLITASCETDGPDSMRRRLVPRANVSRSSNASFATDSPFLSMCDCSRSCELRAFDMQRRRCRQSSVTRPTVNCCEHASAARWPALKARPRPFSRRTRLAFGERESGDYSSYQAKLS